MDDLNTIYSSSNFRLITVLNSKYADGFDTKAAKVENGIYVEYVRVANGIIYHEAVFVPDSDCWSYFLDQDLKILNDLPPSGSIGYIQSRYDPIFSIRSLLEIIF